MKSVHSLRVALETEEALYTGNNTLMLAVRNTSHLDYQQVVVRLGGSPGITLRPSKIPVAPLLANSTETVPITLYATRPGKYEVTIQASAFPAPKEGFLHTALQLDVIPQPDAPGIPMAAFIYDDHLLSPDISKEVSVQQEDIYSSYEAGLRRLLNRIERDHPRHSDALAYQHRLKENIAQSRRYGDTDTRRAERTEIIERLNELTLSVLDITFSELCGGTEDQQLSEYALKPLAAEMAQVPQSEKIFDIAVMRDLLTIALNDSNLNDLCQDYFPEVYRDFSEGMTTSKRKRLLIDYCTRHNQFQQLVRQIRKINPEQYEAYFPYLVKPVTDKFKSEKDADQIQAASTLGRLGEPGAISLLEAQLLEQQNPDIGYWLAVAIGEIGGSEAKEALDRIQQQLISRGADPYTLLGIEDAQKLAETKTGSSKSGPG